MVFRPTNYNSLEVATMLHLWVVKAEAGQKGWREIAIYPVGSATQRLQHKIV
jgi:hypothetical protein